MAVAALETLHFEREDWTLFRTVEGLQQRAGVSRDSLRRLVLKELADNALDTGARVFVDALGDPSDASAYVVDDDGPGIDGTPEEIAVLFSIRRLMRSTKLLRLPMRGALGNGLRVVAGAVLASGGKLVVTTRNQRIELRPEFDGSTSVASIERVDHPVGTRIEITFGPALPSDEDAMAWARVACRFGKYGPKYDGKSSPFWYDAAQFHELLLASGSLPVRTLITRLQGCSGAKAGQIVNEAGLERASCLSVDRRQATILLEAARLAARDVNPMRLGHVGPDAIPDHHYAVSRGTVCLGGEHPQARIPVVIEAWAKKCADAKLRLVMMVNRTPVTAPAYALRSDDKWIEIYGCGLNHELEGTPKKGGFTIFVNVTTPYCPITSDGKAPDLGTFGYTIAEAVIRAVRKAQRAAPETRTISKKDVVLEHLEDAIAKASGDGQYRFNQRQVLYALRPFVKDQTGADLSADYFGQIITDYEAENGEIPGMYREPRGSIHHPHTGETIPLGTLNVENYERPAWLFNKVVYIEKEGFAEALKDVRWAERHDVMLLSSKGFSGRAARDLVDQLAEHDEPVTVFCVHDADAAGTMIYQTFQEATKARGARKIRIINLGLEPWEAREMGLEVEDVEQGKSRKAVADYVLERADGKVWETWLQTHRVELNAMTTPEFIAWLDAKMEEHGTGKLIPPEDVIEEELAIHIEARARAAITERILREAGIEKLVSDAVAGIGRPTGTEMAEGITQSFEQKPDLQWRAHVEEIAAGLTRDL
jgi:hypothetical protein